MESIYNKTLKELECELISMGFKKYNASQVFNWVYKHKIKNFNEMTNISKSLIEYLNKTYEINELKLLKKLTNGKASKYLFELSDGEKIECVLLNHNYGASLCISTQVGCNMGCTFCESGRLKKRRDLNLAEMVLQVISVSDIENIKIHSIVIMGIGEPFDNFENLIRFIEVVINNQALEIGQRHITVSTCGITPKIKEFADLATQVNLAISLHASNDKTRSEIMNINKVYKIKDIFDAVDYYIEKTNRKVTIEYILIDGVNDSEEDAYALANLIKGKLMYVNLIPYNETSNLTYKSVSEFKLKRFYDILKKNGIYVITRKNIAEGIDGACGQLRARE